MDIHWKGYPYRLPKIRFPRRRHQEPVPGYDGAGNSKPTKSHTLKPVADIPVYWRAGTTSPSFNPDRLSISYMREPQLQPSAGLISKPELYSISQVRKAVRTYDSRIAPKSSGKLVRSAKSTTTQLGSFKPNVTSYRDGKIGKVSVKSSRQSLRSLSRFSSKSRSRRSAAPSVQSVIRSVLSDAPSRSPSQKRALAQFTRELARYAQKTQHLPRRGLMASPSATTISANTIKELNPYRAQFASAGLAVTSTEQRGMARSSKASVRALPGRNDNRYGQKKSLVKTYTVPVNGGRKLKPAQNHKELSFASGSTGTTVIGFTPPHEKSMPRTHRPRKASSLSSDHTVIGFTPPHEKFDPQASSLQRNHTTVRTSHRQENYLPQASQKVLSAQPPPLPSDLVVYRFQRPEGIHSTRVKSPKERGRVAVVPNIQGRLIKQEHYTPSAINLEIDETPIGITHSKNQLQRDRYSRPVTPIRIDSTMGITTSREILLPREKYLELQLPLSRFIGSTYPQEGLNQQQMHLPPEIHSQVAEEQFTGRPPILSDDDAERKDLRRRFIQEPTSSQSDRNAEVSLLQRRLIQEPAAFGSGTDHRAYHSQARLAGTRDPVLNDNHYMEYRRPKRSFSEEVAVASGEQYCNDIRLQQRFVQGPPPPSGDIVVDNTRQRERANTPQPQISVNHISIDHLDPQVRLFRQPQPLSNDTAPQERHTQQSLHFSGSSVPPNYGGIPKIYPQQPTSLADKHPIVMDTRPRGNFTTLPQRSIVKKPLPWLRKPFKPECQPHAVRDGELLVTQANNKVDKLLLVSSSHQPSPNLQTHTPVPENRAQVKWIDDYVPTETNKRIDNPEKTLISGPPTKVSASAKESRSALKTRREILIVDIDDFPDNPNLEASRSVPVLKAPAIVQEDWSQIEGNRSIIPRDTNCIDGKIASIASSVTSRPSPLPRSPVSAGDRSRLKWTRGDVIPNGNKTHGEPSGGSKLLPFIEEPEKLQALPPRVRDFKELSDEGVFSMDLVASDTIPEGNEAIRWREGRFTTNWSQHPVVQGSKKKNDEIGIGIMEPQQEIPSAGNVARVEEDRSGMKQMRDPNVTDRNVRHEELPHYAVAKISHSSRSVETIPGSPSSRPRINRTRDYALGNITHKLRDARFQEPLSPPPSPPRLEQRKYPDERQTVALSGPESGVIAKAGIQSLLRKQTYHGCNSGSFHCEQCYPSEDPSPENSPRLASIPPVEETQERWGNDAIAQETVAVKSIPLAEQTEKIQHRHLAKARIEDFAKHSPVADPEKRPSLPRIFDGFTSITQPSSDVRAHRDKAAQAENLMTRPKLKQPQFKNINPTLIANLEILNLPESTSRSSLVSKETSPHATSPYDKIGVRTTSSYNTEIFKGLQVATAAASDENIDLWIEEVAGVSITRFLVELSVFEGLDGNALASLARRAAWETARDEELRQLEVRGRSGGRGRE